jgi:hypothetical protein
MLLRDNVSVGWARANQASKERCPHQMLLGCSIAFDAQGLPFSTVVTSQGAMMQQVRQFLPMIKPVLEVAHLLVAVITQPFVMQPFPKVLSKADQ